MKFGKTLIVSNVANLVSGIQPGQWVKDTNCDIRGQYLGHTATGTIVIRWQSGKFAKRDAINNKHLRRFAVTYGAKMAKGKSWNDYKG
jgi:hypothetical protein